MGEEWRQVPGYEGWYEVSDLGRVRSVDRTIVYPNGVEYRKHGKILSPGRKNTVMLGRFGGRLYVMADELSDHVFRSGPPPTSWHGMHQGKRRRPRSTSTRTRTQTTFSRPLVYGASGTAAIQAENTW